MAYYSDIWRIINSSKSSVKRYATKGRVVTDGTNFSPLPSRSQEEINAIIDNEQKQQYTKLCGGKIETLDNVKDRSVDLRAKVLNNFTSGQSITKPVMDTIMNYATGASMPGIDPSRSAVAPHVAK